MKIADKVVLHAPRERVWAALNDPAVLVRTIPGCEQLETIGPDSYGMTITAGVASIKGTYKGEVALSDKQPLDSFRLRASGSGAPGTVSTDVRVQLIEADANMTELEYEADAVLGGMVGGVGQRMLVGVARKTAREFFKAVDGELNNAPSMGGSGAPVAAPTPGSTAVVDGVFTAPSRVTANGVAASGEFLRGAVLGAGVALLGVLAGALAARRK